MAKSVKEVFFNCISNVPNFKDANIDEIKFSKKLNSVILYASSDANISLPEIERFENDVVLFENKMMVSNVSITLFIFLPFLHL